MSGFGWSVGDIVLASKLVAKLAKALKETGGARDDYQQSIYFLTGLETTLTNIAAAGNVLPQSTATRETLQQTENIIRALAPLLEDVRRFEGSLGAQARGNRVRQTTSRLRWSFRQAGAVENLESRISVPLATVNANIGIQILQLIQSVQANLPSSVCNELSARIDATLPTHLRCELEPVSRAIESQASATRQIVQSLATNEALQLVAQQDLRNSLTEQMARMNAQMRLMEASIKSNSRVLMEMQNTSVTKINGSITAQQLFSPRKRRIRSLQILSRTLRELLLAFLELVWPLVLLLLQKMQAAGSHLTRLLISDSIIFEDALGRTRYLPFEFFQHWDVFLPYLHKSFEQVPGMYHLSRRRYHLVNSRTGNIIDPQLWSANVKPGSRLSMAMVLFKVSGNKRACPHCGGEQRWIEANTFASCSTCDALFRHFEPGQRKYITPTDGHYNGKYMSSYSDGRNDGLNTIRSANRAIDRPEWPTLTFPAMASTSTRIQDVTDNAVPVQNYRVFKKVDVLFVNDPERTVAILEELIDLVCTHGHFEEILDGNSVIDLRRFISLVRFEVRQDIKFFDFKPWYMHNCGKTINALQDWLDGSTLLPNRDSPATVDWQWTKKAFLDFAPSLRQDIFDGCADHSRTLVIILKTLPGRTLIFRVETHTTTNEVKDMLLSVGELHPSSQCLVYRGRKLEDGRCMEDCGVSTSFYIHVVLRYRAHGAYYYDDPDLLWLLYRNKMRLSLDVEELFDQAFLERQQLLYQEATRSARRVRTGRGAPSSRLDL